MKGELRVWPVAYHTGFYTADCIWFIKLMQELTITTEQVAGLFHRQISMLYYLVTGISIRRDDKYVS